MKNAIYLAPLLFLTLALGLPSTAAAAGDQLIFDALQVKETKAKLKGKQREATEKSVGALTCRKIKGAKSEFSCRLHEQYRDNAAIYRALGAKEESKKEKAGPPAQTKKSVGRLTCLKTKTSTAEDYACSLDRTEGLRDNPLTEEQKGKGLLFDFKN